MGKGGGGATQRVTNYYMTVHYGICHGPVDSLTRIRVNEKVAWRGNLTRQAKIFISNLNLFGGVRKEGGVQGDFYWMPGNFTQVVDSYVATKYGRTPATMPGYRGLANGMFTDRPGTSALPGFYWSSNSPFILKADFQGVRIFRDWYPEKASIFENTIGSQKVAISFTIDDSLSMAGSKLASMKTAMGLVFDDIRNAIASGVEIDIHVAEWAATASSQVYSNATEANIDALETFVNGFGADQSGTNFDAAATAAVNFFNDRIGESFDKRAWFFITDGEPVPVGSDDTAAATAADLLNRDTGTYSFDNNSTVDCYGINIELGTTTATAKLDNTPEDGVPVVSGASPEGLVDAVRAVLLTGLQAECNPAHMIYEILTNTAWGLGAPTSTIDDTAFRSAADTFFDEGLGLSMIWGEQTEIENYVQEILDHVEAALYVSPSTGLWVLKPLRDDYAPASLPVYDESNSKVTKFVRRSPGEIINEIVVTWTNPENEEEQTVALQDLGGIVATGGQILSDSRNYYGVRSEVLAWQLAQRDLAAAVAPLATVELLADRTAWNISPGDVIKVTSAKHGATEEIVRVMKVNRGKVGDSDIRINGTTDIYSVPRPDFELPDSGDPDPQGQEPTEFDNVIPFTFNYFLTGASIPGVDPSTAAYPDAYVGVLADTTNTDAQELELYGEIVDPGGTVTIGSLGVKSFISKAELAEFWDAEAETTTAGFNNITRGPGPEVSGFMVIGNPNTPENETELCFIQAFSGGNYTIWRGVLDTLPREWPIETEVRFFSINTIIADQSLRADAEVLDYYALMTTTLGQAPLTGATLHQYTVNDRPWRPTRPANITVNGVGYQQTVNATGVDPIPITWVNRNRVTEDAQLLKWDDANTTPESGQETRIRVLDPSDLSVNFSVDVAEGLTSYNLAASAFSGLNAGLVQITSLRDGYESYQPYEQYVVITGGFGYNFGIDLGGLP